jgi:uncharacterized protein
MDQDRASEGGTTRRPAAAEREGEPVLTTPDVLEHVAPVVPTANAWLALPDVDVRTVAVGSANVLHLGASGLVEFLGEPLLRATVEVDGAPVHDGAWELELLASCVPRFTARLPACSVTATIACPPDHAGAVVAVHAVATGTDPVAVTIGVEGSFEAVGLRVFSPRTVDGPHRVRWDAWTRSLTWEASTGLPLAALAVRSVDGLPPELFDVTPDGVPAADPDGGDTAFPCRWRHRRTTVLSAGDDVELALLLGVGREADGAGLTTVDLARRGWRELIRQTVDWAEARHGTPLPGRPELTALRDRNRLFCLTFAAGRTIDTGELVLVTSRSPRYYVSAAHWTRDSLLWAFPSVLAADPPIAAAWLRTALARYSTNAGVHALYLDGGVLYPGFELDEVAAFHLAVGRYLDTTGDVTLLDDPAVRTGIARVDAALDAALDATTGLYATFLLPSDDPAPLPFVTYDNALTVAALRAAARIRDHLGDDLGSVRALHQADDLLTAIRDRCVSDGPFGPMFSGATDGHGRHELFDEPPGSLLLLPHYEVVEVDDPVLTATWAWIDSEHNPHGPGPEPYATPTCAHATDAWLLAVGNALLAGEHGWLDRLASLPLDAGFACETFDADTGEPRTGLGFATCAGWLAHAIDLAADAAGWAGPLAAVPANGSTSAPPHEPG